MYCPEGSSDIAGCPTGYYCPTPAEKIICPAGKFCPFKTNTPIVTCKSCGEGEQTFQGLEEIAFILVGVMLFLVIVFQATTRLKFMTKKRKEDLLATRDDDSAKTNSLQAHRTRILTIQPILSSIEEKLKFYSSESPDLYSKSAVAAIFPISPDDKLFAEHTDGVVIDAGRLFDFLDVDNSGDLKYDELNIILSFNMDKLAAFVRIMNSLCGQEGGSTSVDRSCFCDTFVETLYLAKFFGPTPDEARSLFYELCSSDTSQTTNTFEVVSLYNSRLRDFLTEVQIEKLLTLLRAKDQKPYDPSKITITVDEFVDAFPETLKQVTTDDLKNVRTGIDIKFDDLALTVELNGTRVDILHELTGRIEAASMTAILGGSGAGKTSLLNALCGRAFYGKVSGRVYINGHQKTLDCIKDATGFVPQDDILYTDLTVRENLVYAGRFRLPAGTSDQELNALADQVLASLALSHIGNSLVGDINRRGISGGEKKRVNIGVELMSRP